VASGLLCVLAVGLVMVVDMVLVFSLIDNVRGVTLGGSYVFGDRNRVLGRGDFGLYRRLSERQA
jgi:hypothetical protein